MDIYNTPGSEVNGRNTEEHLRYQYKQFSKMARRNLRTKPVMWKKFPTKFEEYYADMMVPSYYPRATRSATVRQQRVIGTASFYATLDTLDYSRREGPYNFYLSYASRGAMHHGFVAPFEPRNADLLLATDIQLYLRGGEAYVLLDKCLEEGCTLSLDYEIISASRYIRIESSKMRLMLYENIDKVSPFDIVFTAPLMLAAPFNFSIEDPHGQEARD